LADVSTITETEKHCQSYDEFYREECGIVEAANRIVSITTELEQSIVEQAVLLWVAERERNALLELP
jgi:hypothetical protein